MEERVSLKKRTNLLLEKDKVLFYGMEDDYDDVLDYVEPKDREKGAIVIKWDSDEENDEDYIPPGEVYNLPMPRPHFIPQRK